MRALFAVLLLVVIPSVLLAQSARDYVYVVGSSTVFPFATVVAERFGRASPFKTPKVESTGSGGGFKLFCDGIGVDYPDISNASRAIKLSELATCRANGVEDIIEVKIGYDGIVLAASKDAPLTEVSMQELFLALARDVPGDAPGKLVRNPYRLWSDISPALPDSRIEVLGPPPTSGTRDELVEQAMEAGCRTVAWIAALEDSDPEYYRGVCQTVREDGAFVEVGENDNLIVHKLQTNTRALGIFGFSYLDQNLDKLKGITIDGVPPVYENIASGEYPISRPLYFYIKRTHVDVIPGLRAFLEELTSERALGDEGYLSDRGLITLSADERAQVAADVRSLTTMPLAAKSATR
ncbi:MAG: substrate-binding domain-containing protein [Pseudomonadota bacterium]